MVTSNSSGDRPGRAPTGAAFLLAQLGAHASGRFAERIGPLGFSPPQSGLLYAIRAQPGRSQQAVAEQLGLHPSRLVALVDDLERGGVVERRRNPQDRRHHALHLTARGEAALGDLDVASADHEADVCAALTDDELDRLAALLRRVADHQGLTPGVHPGYRRLREPSDR